MTRTDRISWVEYEALLEAAPILFLPVGAHEQHGPHLPMGTDAIFATRMAEELAARLGGLVLPTLSYGYKSQARSGGGQTFPGTTSLDGSTLVAMTTDILREAAKTRAVVVVEHDMEFVRRLNCKVTVLHEGAVLAEGSIDHVTKDERVIEVYLGR